MAYFEFKCRRCGAIEKNPWCCDEMALTAIIYAVHGIPNKQPQAPEMYGIHTCNDGLGIGVSDLIGFVKESQPAESDNAVGPALHTTAPCCSGETPTFQPQQEEGSNTAALVYLLQKADDAIGDDIVVLAECIAKAKKIASVLSSGANNTARVKLPSLENALELCKKTYLLDIPDIISSQDACETGRVQMYKIIARQLNP